MKLFLKFLKTFGLCVLFYPVLYLRYIIDDSLKNEEHIWLEVLIMVLIFGVLRFLFWDFELIKRLKKRKKKDK